MDKLFFAVCAVLVAFGARGGEPAGDALGYWTGLVEGHTFGEVLEVFAKGPEREWPAVHSSGFPQGREDAARDAAYRALEARLLDGLEAFKAGLRGLPEAEFLSRAGMLLDMREHFSRQNAYANLLFSDAIGCCIAADIAARLASRPGVSKEMMALLERLESVRPDLDAFRDLARAELAGRWPDGDEWPAGDDADGQKRLAALWNALMPGIPVGWPGPEARMDLATLLDTQGVDGLLVRLVASDTTIHTLLPSLAMYRQTAPDAPAGAAYRDFETVLGDTPAPGSLGSRLFTLNDAAGAADELAANVASGKIWIRIAFSMSQIEKWHESRRAGRGPEYN